MSRGPSAIAEPLVTTLTTISHAVCNSYLLKHFPRNIVKLLVDSNKVPKFRRNATTNKKKHFTIRFYIMLLTYSLLTNQFLTNFQVYVDTGRVAPTSLKSSLS